MKPAPLSGQLTVGYVLVDGIAWITAQEAGANTTVSLVSTIAVIGATMAILMGIGKWAVTSFLSFKEKQAEDRREERETFVRMLTEMNERAAKMHAENLMENLKLRHILMGVEGEGGLVKSDRRSAKRRHQFGNVLQALIPLIENVARDLDGIRVASGHPSRVAEIDAAMRRVDQNLSHDEDSGS